MNLLEGSMFLKVSFPGGLKKRGYYTEFLNTVPQRTSNMCERKKQVTTRGVVTCYGSPTFKGEC
jgi:hypothetical protein